MLPYNLFLRDNTYIKFLLFLFPILLFLIFLYMKLEFPYIYKRIIQEDSILENLQAFFYFLTSTTSFLISVIFLRHRMFVNGILFTLLALNSLFISLEEISWGQRIFNIDTPTFFSKHNVQKEITLHNLDTVQPLLSRFYIYTGAYGAFAWIFVYSFMAKVKKEYNNVVNFVIPEWFLSSYFFFVFLFYTTLAYLATPKTWDFLVWRDQEPMEFLLSLGFLLFALTKYIKLKICLHTSK